MVTGKPEQKKVTTIELTKKMSTAIHGMDSALQIAKQLNSTTPPFQLSYSTFTKIKNHRQENIELSSLDKILQYVMMHIHTLSGDEQVLLIDKIKVFSPYIPSIKEWIKEYQRTKKALSQEDTDDTIETPTHPPIPENSTEKSVEEPRNEGKAGEAKTIRKKREESSQTTASIDVDNLSSDELLNLIEAFKKKRLQEILSQRVENGITLYMKWKGLSTAGEQIPFEKIVRAVESMKGMVYMQNMRRPIALTPEENVSAYYSLKDVKDLIFKEDHAYLTSLSEKLNKEIVLVKKQNYFEVFISA